MKASLPFGPHKCLLARLEENSEVSSLLKTRYIREKGRKLDSLSVDTFFSAILVSYGLEYMLMMYLWTHTNAHCHSYWQWDLNKTHAEWGAIWRRHFPAEMNGAVKSGNWPNSMLCCNGTVVTFEVFRHSNNNSIVWRWVLCESFGSQQLPSGLGRCLGRSLSTFGWSTDTIWKLAHSIITNMHIFTAFS